MVAQRRKKLGESHEILTDDEMITIRWWRPTPTNQTCSCAGNTICANHALIEIIDRLIEVIKAQSSRS